MTPGEFLKWIAQNLTKTEDGRPVLEVREEQVQYFVDNMYQNTRPELAPEVVLGKIRQGTASIWGIPIRLVAVVVAVVIAGCGNNPKASGNANYVGVGPAWTETEALPVAQAHCAQYGKSARYSASNGVRHMFDCI